MRVSFFRTFDRFIGRAVPPPKYYGNGNKPKDEVVIKPRKNKTVHK